MLSRVLARMACRGTGSRSSEEIALLEDPSWLRQRSSRGRSLSAMRSVKIRSRSRRKPGGVGEEGHAADDPPVPGAGDLLLLLPLSRLGLLEVTGRRALHWLEMLAVAAAEVRDLWEAELAAAGGAGSPWRASVAGAAAYDVDSAPAAGPRADLAVVRPAPRRPGDARCLEPPVPRRRAHEPEPAVALAPARPPGRHADLPGRRRASRRCAGSPLRARPARLSGRAAAHPRQPRGRPARRAGRRWLRRPARRGRLRHAAGAGSHAPAVAPDPAHGCQRARAPVRPGGADAAPSQCQRRAHRLCAVRLDQVLADASEEPRPCGS